MYVIADGETNPCIGTVVVRCEICGYELAREMRVSMHEATEVAERLHRAVQHWLAWDRAEHPHMEEGASVIRLLTEVLPASTDQDAAQESM
jgi:hypothetical protein